MVACTGSFTGRREGAEGAAGSSRDEHPHPHTDPLVGSLIEGRISDSVARFCWQQRRTVGDSAGAVQLDGCNGNSRVQQQFAAAGLHRSNGGEQLGRWNCHVGSAKTPINKHRE